MQDVMMTKTKSPSMLNSIDDLPARTKLAIFGAGETGQEFARKLRTGRPDVEIVCFLDSFRSGLKEGTPIREPAYIKSFDKNVELIIASVFWSEIAEIIESNFPRNYKILSNDLINQASHLSAYGPFYFDTNMSVELESRFSGINEKFRTELDREILRKLFDLRVYGKEEEFFSFVDQLTRQQKKTFEMQDKYSRHLEFDSINYVIEGGVYDGQDTCRFLEVLKKSPKFKKLYAFDPFLESLYKGEFFKKMDLSSCEFHENVLWDCEERVAFRVDRANPANSKVLRESEVENNGFQDKMHSTVTIDAFLRKAGVPVDLIKLDVEGAEMNVLNGAKDSILKWRPQMAVSLYHRKEHILEIPEFLLSLHNDYKFSISVNNPSFVDMVLYAS
jgi:FkbM family methyltransferase